jgi:hypothetical protein
MTDKNILRTEGRLKEQIIEYVGAKLQPENEEVTIEMVIDVLASEFPEVVLVLAEENFLRGYSQGIEDLEVVGVKTIND